MILYGETTVPLEKTYLVIVHVSENMTSVPGRFYTTVEAKGPVTAINKAWRQFCRAYDNSRRFPLIEFEVRLLS